MKIDKKLYDEELKKLKYFDNIYILGCHIVQLLYRSPGWGRTKLQKTLYLIEYFCQIELNTDNIRKDISYYSQMMNTLDLKFKLGGHVVKKTIRIRNCRLRYNYIPTLRISEMESFFEQYPIDKQRKINLLLSILKLMDLGMVEIYSILYIVWNNRIIRSKEITDELIISDFYDWSIRNSEFSRDFVYSGLISMRKENIVPRGWGRYIDKIE